MNWNASDLTKFYQALQKMTKLDQTWPNLTKLYQTWPNLTKLDQSWPLFFFTCHGHAFSLETSPSMILPRFLFFSSTSESSSKLIIRSFLIEFSDFFGLRWFEKDSLTPQPGWLIQESEEEKLFLKISENIFEKMVLKGKIRPRIKHGKLSKQMWRRKIVRNNIEYRAIVNIFEKMF